MSLLTAGGVNDRRSVGKDGASTHLHRENVTQDDDHSSSSATNAEYVIAEGDEGRQGTVRREDIRTHLGAASVDGAKVDMGALALSDKVPEESNVLRALPEAGRFRESDGRFAAS
jgi:hypothetical protein